MSTSEQIHALHAQSAKASLQLSAIRRGTQFLRDSSPKGARMTEAQARAAFGFVCDSLGLDPAATGEKFIEFAVSAKTDSPASESA